VRAVNREDWRVLLDHFATREHEELLYVAVDATDVIPMPLLVIGHHARGTGGVCEGTLLNCGVGDADLVLTLDGDGEERRSVLGAWSVGAWSVGAWSVGAWSVGAWSVGAWSVGAWSVGAWSVGAWSVRSVWRGRRFDARTLGRSDVLLLHGREVHRADGA